MNWDRLYFETYRQFDCDDLSVVVAGHRGFKPHQLEKRMDKKREVCSELNSFREIMQSKPVTLNEAIVKRRQQTTAALGPIAAWVAWQLIKFFVTSVFKWAWKKYQEQQNELAAGKVA